MRLDTLQKNPEGHAVKAVEALYGQYVLTGHARHAETSVWPITGWYVPAGHASEVVLSAGQYEPVGHAACATVKLLSLYEITLMCETASCALSWLWSKLSSTPAICTCTSIGCVGDVVPVGHISSALQATCVAGDEQYEPAAQLLAAVEPVGQYCPDAHGTDVAGVAHTCPAVHIEHAPLA